VPDSGRPFNLDELLGEKHVQHYLKFLSPRTDFYVSSLGNLQDAYDRDVSSALRPPGRDEIFTGPAPEILTRRGAGAEACSPSGILRVQPEWVWDNCGYYARLGVPWWAGRRELATAYLKKAGPARDCDLGGQLAYALHQLLDPYTRYCYDRLKPGELFLLDMPTAERIRARAARRAAEETAAGGVVVTADDVLGHWGLRSRPAAAGQQEPPAPPAEEQVASHVLGASDLFAWQRNWSWYEKGECPQSPQMLEDWQKLMISAFRGISQNPPKFAVGFHSGPDPEVVSSPDGRLLVCLLGTRPPTEEMAAEAAQRSMAIAATRENKHA
jgi:hypothetical protein